MDGHAWTGANKTSSRTSRTNNEQQLFRDLQATAMIRLHQTTYRTTLGFIQY